MMQPHSKAFTPEPLKIGNRIVRHCSLSNGNLYIQETQDKEERQKGDLATPWVRKKPYRLTICY